MNYFIKNEIFSILKLIIMETSITNLTVKKTHLPKKYPKESELGFGIYFTDHMFVMDYSPETGWVEPTIQPYSSVLIEPGCIVFHYSQAVFDGLKSFLGVDDRIRLFRVKDYFNRFNRSAAGLCIPQFNTDEVIGYLKELLIIDKEWHPSSIGTSIYIRPLIIARDNLLGVRSSKTFSMFIVLSPVGTYYAEGFNPVKILVEEEHSRTAPGGLGDLKTPANYAASLFSAERAKAKGFTQVLWLDAVEKKWVEEVGTTNIFFRIGDELITPPLEGTILPGITRDSIIKIAKREKIKVTERRISIDEVYQAHAKGTLKEVFGSGTAAVVSPVGKLSYKGKMITINNNEIGEWSQFLYDLINSMQYGKSEDEYGWITILD
jgi:branched-chain amino acid aminotransferase